MRTSETSDMLGSTQATSATNTTANTYVWSQPTAGANASSNLAVATAQYPILETLVSHLRPSDLVPLAQVCQTVHGHLLGSTASQANLLTKTLCPGHGKRIRRRAHHPCATKGFKILTGCGGEGYNVESRPCVCCGINTCDECRIHVTYHVGIEDPGLDGHRWWAGYNLLYGEPVALYPPSSTNGDDKDWHLPAAQMKSLHDQGRIHIPFHIPAVADPEPLDRILDINLGRHLISPQGRTDGPYQGVNLITGFNLVSQPRTEFVCDECFDDVQANSTNRRAMCECSFRKRYIDRWLCLECYQREQDKDARLEERIGVDEDEVEVVCRKCHCKRKFSQGDTYKMVCNWCDGEIRISNTDSEGSVVLGSDENDQDEDEDEEQEEDDAHWMVLGLCPDGILCCKSNTDGTMAAMINGVQVRGERLGRALVEEWEHLKHEPHNEQDCSRCQTHGHAHGGVEFDDGESDDRESGYGDSVEGDLAEEDDGIYDTAPAVDVDEDDEIYD
ncbi:hypothetical protein P153DRAFT_15719 [Dothidotthia symphoricarpi CBS 119687]|uniref:Uncharacterized protein n=1 Tax=Dothidotthia symphoricarpi CBS 119687 TaxID=1392245 RepID=A0A6A6AE61_9PLEO|nr:uncharacterized protein P153DRAFT_15719 [Dothidotthia symphoricarpi CBS 119687]KAF2129224.1 hypothetical protein P153DRAFT_15719 [Dothidotthia symphoricarpi CBS 119687]